MYAVQTAVNGGSELLIFVPRVAHSNELAGDAREPTTGGSGILELLERAVTETLKPIAV